MNINDERIKIYLVAQFSLDLGRELVSGHALAAKFSDCVCLVFFISLSDYRLHRQPLRHRVLIATQKRKQTVRYFS